MNELRKLLELNTEYPPTEAVWRQLLALILNKKEKPLKGLDKVRYSLMMETQALEKSGAYSGVSITGGAGLPDNSSSTMNTSLPSSHPPPLPEPQVVRFYFEENPYYLDAKDQIYQADPDYPLIGNLVGHIENRQVIINGNIVHKLSEKTVKAKEIHGRNYYLSMKLGAYRGMLQGKRYLWQVGKLNEKGKLELIV